MRIRLVKAVVGAGIIAFAVLCIILLRPKEILKTSLTDDIASINLTKYASHETKETLTLTDNNQIIKVMDLLGKAQKTEKSTVNDTPYTDLYYKAELHSENGIRTFFIYQNGKSFYAEEPYSGIYRLTKKAYKDLTHIYTDGIASTPHYAFANP
ncbi:DUF5301 domain-containing protein [Anaerocolumna chitinilytica]|uniref:DUF5301 domain-containing protein n=1 Tax=Anaerocolumna chitinilytica TaxID=1727145 RepID=A0A7I8DQI3_9FIRM|nr:DUF5301 domain-containing protein [Anaerocolumna chitinilytica]BCJ99531.1 hypothetical protein bsdcttw_25720 [Anaerocolumna chitinilytica]